MPQGDKRLVFNVRERLVSDDLNRLQAVDAAEQAARLRGFHNDAVGDWYSAGGLQTPITSSSPSLSGDVYGGLMVQPDNAGYYLIQPGVAGFLDPTGVGLEDNPYRLINDPGVQTPAALPFTSNAGGGSPRWDVVECQPVDTVISQESRFIFNPATGIASSILVDKVKAGRLTYRVRTGTVGGGFPGVATGWMPLAVICAPAGSSSLLTSDVWDVRPLVRERVRSNPVDGGTGVGFAPIRQAEYRFRLAASATANLWIGSAESTFNGYQAGGILERSTPSTLAQFGSTGVAGGRSGLVNVDLADNLSPGFALGANANVYLYALFPAMLPRWQRYSQAPVGTGRVPNGPRGILVASTTQANAAGIVTGLPLPAAASFGASTSNGCLLAAARCDGSSVLQPASANAAEHFTSSALFAGTIATNVVDFDFPINTYFPLSARRVLVSVTATTNNSTGVVAPGLTGQLMMGSEVLATFITTLVPGVVGSPCYLSWQCWAPCLPRANPTNPTLPGTMRLRFTLTSPGISMSAANLFVLAWSSSDRA